MEENLVSVITPVYNSENYLESCISSLINQTYKNCEFILIDDFSTDKSTQIIKKYERIDSRIKLISMKKNFGASIARNKGIELSKGKYLAFCDSDDYWDTEKLNLQINYMTTNNISISHTNYFIFKSHSDILQKKQIKSKSKITYNDILFKNYIGFSTLIINQSIIGKKYMKFYKSCNDYAYLLNLLKNQVSYCYGRPLSYYRVHNDSLSSNKIKNSINHLRVLKKETDLGLFMVIFYFVCYVFISINSYLKNIPK